MPKVPDFLTRYYVAGENPYLSLNDYSPEQANNIKKLTASEMALAAFMLKPIIWWNVER